MRMIVLLSATLFVAGCQYDPLPTKQLSGLVSEVDTDGSFSLEDIHGNVVHYKRCYTQEGHFEVWRGEQVDMTVDMQSFNGAQCVEIVSSTDVSRK